MNIGKLSQVLIFFFNDTATTEIYTLSLHDALPISEIQVFEELVAHRASKADGEQNQIGLDLEVRSFKGDGLRSEEHTSELQSRQYLVCRLLLEKKNHTRELSTHYPPLHLYVNSHTE